MNLFINPINLTLILTLTLTLTLNLNPNPNLLKFVKTLGWRQIGWRLNGCA